MEARRALARERAEAGREVDEVISEVEDNPRMEEYLEWRARRDAEREKRREAYRKRAEERKQRYSEELQARVEKMEQREAELAAQLEKMHKEADERRQKLREYMDAMRDMTPEERMAYVEEHRDEVFGSSGEERPREYRAPARPPWTMQPPRPYPYAAP
jgi:predicted RNase H-like nuclease (RuvC/YqgF family)